MSSPTDSRTSPTLLGRLKDLRDQQAWAEFVHRYGPRIYRFLRRHGLQDADADDVAQVIVSKLAVRMQTYVYDPARSFRAWLKAVTRNAWKDFLTDRRRNPAWGKGGDGADARLQAIADEALAKELDEPILQEVRDEALARVRLRVEARTWTAFRMVVLEEQPVAEAADQTGMKVNAIYRAINRVRAMLEEEMKRLDPPEEPS
jgi:RNA polymerase sigma-70 factor (ECF subfamily)